MVIIGNSFKIAVTKCFTLPKALRLVPDILSSNAFLYFLFDLRVPLIIYIDFPHYFVNKTYLSIVIRKKMLINFSNCLEICKPETESKPDMNNLNCLETLPRNIAFNLTPPSINNNSATNGKKKLGRNDRINIVYQNGTRKDNVKYKIVQDDIQQGKCRISKYQISVYYKNYFRVPFFCTNLELLSYYIRSFQPKHLLNPPASIFKIRLLCKNSLISQSSVL